MKLKKVFIYVLLIVLVAIALVIFNKLGTQAPVFRRTTVQIEKGEAIVNEKGTDGQFAASLKEIIPNGTLMKFSGEGSMVIRPEIEGKKGVFFTFSVRNRNKEEIKTDILLFRDGEKRKLQKFSGRSYTHSFAKELQFKRGDEIHIQLQGEGVVAVNQPFIYSILDKKKRKYVFVIALDTLRDDHVGQKRNGIELTPAINRFKQDAVIFSNTFAQSNWTLPSFISLFTGLYEYNHQITRTTSLEQGKPFLMEQIASQFFTVNFNSGLWMEGKFGFSRGVDFFSVMSSPKDSLGGKILFEKAVNFLKKNNIPSVFMFLHTYQIHSPYAPPPEYLNQVAPNSSYKSLDSYFYEKQFHQGIDQAMTDAMKVLYDAEILAFDDFFDQFMKFLKEMGIYDQSQIVFFSDHGEEFYEHKGWAHCHSLYNEVIKVPLYIKFPGNQFKGKILEANAGVIDIFPTLMDYWKIETNELKPTIDGISLLPLLEGEKIQRENLFSSTSVTWLVKNIPPKFSIIKGKYKLIFNYPYSQESLDYFSTYGLPPEEKSIAIFDLSKDPEEKNPLSEMEKKPLMRDFMPLIKRIKENIENAMKRERLPTIRMSEEEKKKLKSLGYL